MGLRIRRVSRLSSKNRETISHRRARMSSETIILQALVTISIQHHGLNIGQKFCATAISNSQGRAMKRCVVIATKMTLIIFVFFSLHVWQDEGANRAPQRKLSKAHQEMKCLLKRHHNKDGGRTRAISE